MSGELRFSFTSEAGDRTIDSTLFVSDGYAASCSPPVPQFLLSFTVFNPPRTPTPTVTATPTKTPTPFPFHPISITPGLPGALGAARTPTPTPTKTPLPPLPGR